MKIQIAILFLLALSACQTKSNQDHQTEEKTISTPAASDSSKDQSFYVGTYTGGESEGIYKYALQDNGHLKKIGLAAKTNGPSFLTKSSDQKYLLAVNEVDDQDGAGTVESYKITGDKLTLMNRSSSGGAHPCYVAINEAGYVLTANYTGGNVGLLQLNKEGKLSDVLYLQQHTGKGMIRERQEGPHAHFASFEPDGNGIISVDLGTNELWFSTLNTKENKLIPSKPQKIKMASGAGPRHLAFHPNKKWIYVVNELNWSITHLEKNDQGIYKKKLSIPTTPEEWTDANTCADIHISADGKFLYASNRGHNSIVIYSINSTDGSLTLVGYESTKGQGPRNFSLSPDNNYLLVANQITNDIVSFKRDKSTGLLTFVHQIKAPTPVCILF